jgi:hypothetical protein
VHARFEFIGNRGIQCVLLMRPELRENTSGHRESVEDYSQLLSLKASNFELYLKLTTPHSLNATEIESVHIKNLSAYTQGPNYVDHPIRRL